MLLRLYDYSKEILIVSGQQIYKDEQPLLARVSTRSW
jgi:hypothetical protein